MRTVIPTFRASPVRGKMALAALLLGLAGVVAGTGQSVEAATTPPPAQVAHPVGATRNTPACDTSVSGAITGTDNAQVGRLITLLTASSCPTNRPAPGVFDNLPRHYDAYSFVNPSSSAACVTITLNESCLNGVLLQSAAYLGSFDPLNPNTNYLGDIGPVPNLLGGAYAVTVPAGATYVVVVNELLPASVGCSDYTLTLSAATCQVPGPVATQTAAASQTAGAATQTAAASQTAGAATQTAVAGQTAVAATQTAGAGQTAVAATQTAAASQTAGAMTATPAPGTQTAVAATQTAAASQTAGAMTTTPAPGTQTAVAATQTAAASQTAGAMTTTPAPGTQTAVAATQTAAASQTAGAMTTTPAPGTQTAVAATQTAAASQTAGAMTTTPAPGTQTAVAATQTAAASQTGAMTTTPAPGTQTAVAATQTASAQCTHEFSDVQAADYFHAPVLYLACHGIVSGYSDGTYRPYNNTTRGQMAKIVVLAFNLPLIAPPTLSARTFSDVLPDNVFYQLIETAAAHHIVTCYTCGGSNPQTGGLETCDNDGRAYYRPANPVTRGQLTKIVVIGASWAIQNPPNPSFSDMGTENVFYPFIETAMCHTIISGYNDDTFRPNNFALPRPNRQNRVRCDGQQAVLFHSGPGTAKCAHGALSRAEGAVGK